MNINTKPCRSKVLLIINLILGQRAAKLHQFSSKTTYHFNKIITNNRKPVAVEHWMTKRSSSLMRQSSWDAIGAVGSYKDRTQSTKCAISYVNDSRLLQSWLGIYAINVSVSLDLPIDGIKCCFLCQNAKYKLKYISINTPNSTYHCLGSVLISAVFR